MVAEHSPDWITPLKTLNTGVFLVYRQKYPITVFKMVPHNQLLNQAFCTTIISMYLLPHKPRNKQLINFAKAQPPSLAYVPSHMAFPGHERPSLERPGRATTAARLCF